MTHQDIHSILLSLGGFLFTQRNPQSFVRGFYPSVADFFIPSGAILILRV